MNEENLKILIYWINERRSILNGNETKDEIFKKYHFTNVSRLDDKYTKFLLYEIINKTYNEHLVFNLILHRNISNLKTSKEIGIKTSFNKNEFMIQYNKIKKQNKIFFTNKFIRCFSIEKFLEMLEYINYNKKEIYNNLIKEKTLKNYYNVFKLIPLIGNFMAWQLALDLSYNDNFYDIEDEKTFIKLGPGANNGLKLIKINFFSLLYILNSTFKLNLSSSDLEHSLCEFSKYYKIKYGNGYGKKRNETEI